MRFLRKSLTGMFLLAATIGLMAFALDMVRSAIADRGEGDQRRGGGRERVFAVNIVPFEPGQQIPILEVFGEVQSRRALDIRSAVGGSVVELHPNFTEGGAVQAGEVLFRIDPADAETALALAEADLTDAETELREAQRTIGLAQDLSLIHI